jgi:HEPN domain-containing protein
MAAMEHESSRPHLRESSFVSLLSGWATQGVQTFFTTQRILLDLAMRQNANVMHAVRQQLTDPHHSPTAILSEVAGAGVSNFIEGQKILLDLGQQQNEILLSGVKERVGDWPAVHAVTDLLRRSLAAFIDMQQEFLKIAGKQTHTWVEAAKNGKPYQGEHLMEMAREGMENFVKAQKEFLDVVAEETAKATSGKHTNGTKKMKKTELAELARQATESFIDAQKKLADVAGQQMSFNLKSAGKAMELLTPFPFLPLADLTREGVKSYVDAQKALMDVFVKSTHAPKPAPKTVPHAKRPPRAVKKHPVAAVAV